MARRNRDLAGLAALGALGMYAARSGKDKVRADGGAPVEDRGTMREPTIEELARGSRDLEGGITPQGLNELGEKYSLEEAPSRPASATTRTMKPATRGAGMKESAESETRGSMARRRNVAGDYARKMGATAEEITAYNRAQQTTGAYTKPREGVTQVSTRGTRPDLSTPEGRKKAEQDQALERVTPEEYLVGGPGLKAMHAAAKNLARPRQLLLPAPAARPPATGAGEGFVMYKKGGAVKAKKMASGGSTSSASKRADGIASRGKTKCKMY